MREAESINFGEMRKEAQELADSFQVKEFYPYISGEIRVSAESAETNSDLESILSRIGEKGKEGVHAVLVREGQILRGLRKYQSGDKWIIPGGKCEENETLAQTLAREISEETGISEYEVARYLGSVEGIQGGIITNVFLVKTDEEAQLLEDDKFAEWRWMTPEESEELGANPLITELIKNNL